MVETIEANERFALISLERAMLGVVALYILMGKLGWNGTLLAVIAPFLLIELVFLSANASVFNARAKAADAAAGKGDAAFIDPEGDRIGELEAVYVDTASDEPSFVTVKV